MRRSLLQTCAPGVSVYRSCLLHGFLLRRRVADQAGVRDAALLWRAAGAVNREGPGDREAAG